jgi:glycosyltransferase involved in cell wall biosynthesis
MRTLSQCDICLQPLDDTKFNRYKSDIKFLEAGAAGLAVIASPVVYEDYIDHGKTGLIASSPKEWKDLLMKLVKDVGYRKTLGANAKAYVRENRLLMQHAHKRLEWYRDLWSRKEQLNQRLFELYPNLKP